MRGLVYSLVQQKHVTKATAERGVRAEEKMGHRYTKRNTFLIHLVFPSQHLKKTPQNNKPKQKKPQQVKSIANNFKLHPVLPLIGVTRQPLR